MKQRKCFVCEKKKHNLPQYLQNNIIQSVFKDLRQRSSQQYAFVVLLLLLQVNIFVNKANNVFFNNVASLHKIAVTNK